ncbi:DNA repair protein RecO [Acetobacter fallax]|uniref:DNA repair protein RecO n=1 Tax=Acetobacter fallax TaxID=1737473 RepID=A0ABX0KDT9_9PROT|nr:DNA repair protein RecO [Acetobacter fallax]NHO36681.1 DNA repair protein RecO [Acetobacter fallax]
MNWEAPALVLSASLFGEANALVHLFTSDHGVAHGLVRGGMGRRGAATWQAGNLVQARWNARLPEQLGTVSGETIQANAARAFGSRISLACLSSICAVTDAALPEGEVYSGLFDDTERVLSRIGTGVGIHGEAAEIATLLRWEMVLLQDLGFALDLSACAVTGVRNDLTYVSPRTGRAVSRQGAGIWASRLLPLPDFFLNFEDNGTPSDWSAGLRLTGHFLARDVFGPLHRPLPAARVRLADIVQSLPGSMTEGDQMPSGKECGDLP